MTTEFVFELIIIFLCSWIFVLYLVKQWRQVKKNQTRKKETVEQTGAHRRVQTESRFKRKACRRSTYNALRRISTNWELEAEDFYKYQSKIKKEKRDDSFGWATCDADVLFGVMQFLPDEGNIKNMRLVNHHWCKEISQNFVEMTPESSRFCDIRLESFADHFIGLRKLVLRDTHLVSDSWLIKLSNFATQLQVLNIRFTYKWKPQHIGEDGLKAIRSMSNVNHLELSGCTCLTLSGICILSKMQQLKYLDLSNSNIGNGSLMYIASMKNLTHLDLSENYQISHIGLQFLDGLCHLKKLLLKRCCKIKERELKRISEFSSLEHLDVRMCHSITGLSFDFYGMHRILSLDLLDCISLLDSSIYFISRMKFLSSLVLQGCTNISDSGLAFFEEHSSLKYLRLGYNQRISNQGLYYLKSCLSLQTLSLLYLPNVTICGIEFVASIDTLRHLSIVECGNIGIRDTNSLIHKLENLSIDQYPTHV